MNEDQSDASRVMRQATGSEDVVRTLLLEQLADSRQVSGCSKVFVPTIPWDLLPLVVQHPRTHSLDTHTHTHSQNNNLMLAHHQQYELDKVTSLYQSCCFINCIMLK